MLLKKSRYLCFWSSQPLRVFKKTSLLLMGLSCQNHMREWQCSSWRTGWNICTVPKLLMLVINCINWSQQCDSLCCFWLAPEVPARTFQDAATGVSWIWSSFCSKDEGQFGVPQLEHPHRQNKDEAAVCHLCKKFRRRQKNLGCLVAYICMERATLDARRLAIVQARWNALASKWHWRKHEGRQGLGRARWLAANSRRLGLLQGGVCISLLGSEEVLLEMSSGKFTLVALWFQGCKFGCFLEGP